MNTERSLNDIPVDVCDLRLDFETFDLRGPTAVTDGATGDDCPDKMTIAVCSKLIIYIHNTLIHFVSVFLIFQNT